ncbi:hypothetical protein [Candidatus Poriferisodalis sp.]|uniref:hypothetical protein n=1 Tax=Candidatus Poriferisodalis sp. TaxID=3101277 RepID=UPI003B5C838D
MGLKLGSSLGADDDVTLATNIFVKRETSESAMRPLSQEETDLVRSHAQRRIISAT